MGKQGPCYHCGINSTPLWRNGPVEKPVLCNACGSRYRIRGTLENYAPKHAQLLPQPPLIAKRTTSSFSNSNFKSQHHFSHLDVSFIHKSTSSLSAISSPLTQNVKQEEEEEEEYNGLQIKGQIEEKICKSWAPSRKRSMVVYRHLTLVEKLQKDLFNIMKYEDNFMSQEDEDDLLIYNANSLQVSPNEIGIGSILLKTTN
ncbi:GATA transcription factor 27 [Euphorbia peplus]|nr:GATA transcription factor 27 [Euphorbia peplus]